MARRNESVFSREDGQSAKAAPSWSGVDRSFFEGTDAVSFLRDSTALGWDGAYAAVTLERPYEAVRQQAPAVWLAVGLTETSLRRFIRGRESYNPSAPRRALTITPPGEHVRDVVGVTAKALHVFLCSSVISEVAVELFGEHAEGMAVAPAFSIDDPVMLPLLEAMKLALHDPPCEARLKVDYLTRAMAAHVLRKQAVETHAVSPLRAWPDLSARHLQLLQDYIQSNLSNELAIEDMANLLGLSRAQFLRRFKASTGTTPHQHVMVARVQKAQALLADSRLNLAQVAASSGFANPGHLSSVFSRFVKVSPSAFRSQIV